MIIGQCDKIFTVEYTPDGAPIVICDILGLSTVHDDVDNTQLQSNAIFDDLVGLDFTRTSSVIQSSCPSTVVRRSAVGRNDQAPPAVARNVNHRAGIVDEGQGWEEHGLRHSISLQEKLSRNDADCRDRKPLVNGHKPELASCSSSLS